jgi:DNA-binding CsgD family transcriptional regulator/tetratricopeptide (TPR) repeat protein
VPVCALSTNVFIAHLSCSSVDRIVAVDEREHIGRRALSFALGLRIFARAGPYHLLVGCAILAGVVARANEVFVGRVRELGELQRVLAAARSGSGSTVLVAGEAGIGKTRLASELGRRARDAGFEVLLGRSIDLVGTELPYQPFVEALRPLGELPQVEGQRTGSQLRLFEDTLALLTDHAVAPRLLVLEDLHWADTSTLDLVVFLAHNIDSRPLLVLATYRADEPSSAARMGRLANGVQRSGSALELDLRPLEHDELVELLATHAGDPLPAALMDAIVARAEGNPFFAEELLAAAGDPSGELPRRLRDLLLQRVTRLDRRTQGLLRAAAAAGRDVGYPLLCAVAALPEGDVRESLRAATEYGVLVADQASGSFRFRHPLLAEAIYTTILPGEREELHAKLAEELACSGGASAAELAPHWAAAGRTRDALAASVAAACEAEAVFGLAEALAHIERALALWDAVPDAADLVGLDVSELCGRAARLASETGAAPRAIELTRRALELVGSEHSHRAALLEIDLGEYLYELGDDDAGFAALERAVEIAPAEPPSPERAFSLGSLAGGLMLRLRHQESLATAERALELARRVGAGRAEVRALTVVGVDLAHLGRDEEGLDYLRQALQLAEEIGDHWGLDRVYVNFTDVLEMLGRPRESARLGREGLEAMRRYGIHSSLVVSNLIEALLASGDWDEADRLSAGALRSITASFPYALFVVRALVEIGRGEFDAAHAHFQAAETTLRPDRGHGLYDSWVADLALWEHRWADAEAAIEAGLAHARQREAAHIRVQVCAKGLRAQAELAALARARRDADALRDRLERARMLLETARHAAAEASAITPNATGWLALAVGEYERARGIARPELWSDAAGTWEQLERPPLAAYCRWREAEALVTVGAPRAEASAPLGEAYAVAARIGAPPLLHEIELFAERARLDPMPPDAGPNHATHGLEEPLGLTPREAEVLALVARGYTNREIAATLVISVKTAGVHVSHILRKLDATNRIEAAAIAHRLLPPHVWRREFEG